MQPSNFDELTKALASSPSRRHALKVIATASLGGMFGLVGIRSVFAAANSNCAKWCAQVFGPNTSAAGRCTSDAAKGKGLCKQCGSKPPSSICCVRNNSGFCNGTSAATCCPSGQHCQSGTCVPDCTPNGEPCNSFSQCCSQFCFGTCQCPGGSFCNNYCPCPSGQPCINGSCCPTQCCSEAQCATGVKACLSNGTCVTQCVSPGDCFATCGAGAFCDGNGNCHGPLTTDMCSSDNDCPTGQLCESGFCAVAC